MYCNAIKNVSNIDTQCIIFSLKKYHDTSRELIKLSEYLWALNF